jgi:hypothetical protein
LDGLTILMICEPKLDLVMCNSTVIMEDLTSLMQSIDLISKSIPEGEYLKMCHNMKNLYKVVPRPTSPEAHLPRVRVPRPIVDSDSDSEDDAEFQIVPRYEAERAELAGIGAIIGRYTREIKQVESRLRYLKIKQRVTAGVRKDAVRERAQQLGFRLREYTIEELRAKGHHIPDERSFYKNYLERQNLITRDVMSDLRDDLIELNTAKVMAIGRRGDLQTLIFGAPLL